MKINLYTIGKVKNTHCAELTDEYAGRIVKSPVNVKFEMINLPDKDSENKQVAIDLAEKYNLSIQNTYFLAEWGKAYDTKQFIELINSNYQMTEDMNFVVGNAWGWERDHNDQAKYLSLSSMTFAHELSTVLLLEQIYRFTDHTSGGKYGK